MTVAYRWMKASGSGSEGACVELARAGHPGAELGVIRDSKKPGGPILSADLSVLIAAVKSMPVDH